MIIPLQKVDYPDFKHNSHEHESIELKENYLTYKLRSEVRMPDEKTGLPTDFSYDLLQSIGRTSIEEIQVGYDNEKELYDVQITTISLRTTFTFPSKAEALKTYNTLVEWRWK